MPNKTAQLEFSLFFSLKPFFLKLHTCMPHHNTLAFLNALLILNIPNIHKYRHIEEKEVFFENTWKKTVSCPYLRKYQHFKENYDIFRSPLKIVFCSYPKISTFRRNRRFLRLFWKIVSCLRKYQHIGIKLVYEII